jgi:hypothetical protein
MLLSLKPAFLFVHVDKAAGSSIQLALQPYASMRRDDRWRRRLTWLGPLNRLGFYRVMEFPEHASARVARNCLPPKIYDGLFKFAFVRNPWDRLVSRYAYLQRNEEHPRHRNIRKMEFADYLAWEIQRRKMFQHTYVTGTRGEWIVNFIGYYERLREDFAKACAHLSIKADLPRANTSSHRDYRTYYTPALRDLVANEFARDIELFGYTFDGLTEKGLPRGLVEMRA